MTPSAAIKFFKTQVALAAACQTTQSCIANWKARGKIPYLRQLEISNLSDGKLKADRRVRRRVSQN